MSILVVGTIALDDIETPRESKQRILGGSATYVALAARPFVDLVGVVAVVGKDFPRNDRELLQSSGIDLTGVQTLSDHNTFAWGGRYRENMNIRDTTFTHLNALAEFKPLIPSAYKHCKILCLGNLSPQIQIDSLNQINGQEFVVCDTMNYWINHTPEGLKDVMGRIDCLLINDEEATQITGELNLFTAGRKVLTMGPKILIIKKGEHGAILFIEEGIFIAPGFPLEEVRDPTGAGDAFLGAFAGSLANEPKIGIDALKRALIYGCTVASFCVEILGPYKLVNLVATAIQERAKIFHSITEWPSLSGWNACE